ncbi:MAG: aminopeptidase [Blastocatellia bacterium]|jgi:aminopeptidase N|nr:aminopeptidase [Blastocatellia bacterium]
MRTLVTRATSRRRSPLWRPLILSLLFFILPVATTAQRRERLIDTWKPLHYNVTLRLDNQLTEIVSATTMIRAAILKRNVRTIDLDFGELTIDSIKVNNAPAQFDRAPNRLNVRLNQVAKPGKQISITIAYHGKPKDGLILTTDRDGKPSATGDNWPDRVHHWIPCLDHPAAKATVAFSITAPSRDLVVANGAFAGFRGNFGGTTTWSFNESRPIPPYCMVIVVNEGAKLDVPGLLTPLSYYVPQVDKPYALKGFSPAPPALAYFSQLVGPYPYEKLALIVAATRFGGMENSSAIVFSSNLLVPSPSARVSGKFGIPQGTVDVVAHEIAHQWFGDSVTESTWSDIWLSEGFATYFAGLFLQHFEGEAEFQTYMKQAAETVFAYERKTHAPLYDSETEDLFKLLNGNSYQKGAWVLHMLRARLGDEAFFRGVRAYYKTHRDGTAGSEDLRAALEKASGRNLKEFFARWIYGSGHPVYEFGWSSAEFSAAGSNLVVELKQTQRDHAFLDPVTIEVTSGGSKSRFVIQPTGKRTVKSFPLKQPLTAVTLDPDGVLLKEVVLLNKAQLSPPAYRVQALACQ